MRLRSLTTSLLAASLVTGGLLPVSAASAADDTPAARAASWIARELASPTPEFDQFGVAAARTDVVFALAATDREQGAARRALAELTAGGAEYIGPEEAPLAGPLAKVLLAASIAHEEPVGDMVPMRNLEVELRELQGPDGGFAADVFSHALAMIALASTGDGVPASATGWLEERQRPDGAWASDFAPDFPDIDVTAVALQAAVAAGAGAAVEAAAGFLVAEQNPDGSWPSPFGEPNANTAGVGAHALRAAGRTAAADLATEFVVALQTGDGGIRFTAADTAPNGYATLQGALAFASRPLHELEIRPFADVDWDDTFAREIEWLVDSGITRGCSTNDFCPDEQVTRAQMAAFLHRALDGSLGDIADTGPDFTDLSGSVFTDDIQWLAATGITRGCTDDRYCPDDPVTRGQMAAFLYRALIEMGNPR
ncbi:MAG TPA: S-layer homology domain-containing protein [Acidimicrobiia bacterium]|nr:S-layer homology domain-containing protein [Acidimicrobiia bacterium]